MPCVAVGCRLSLRAPLENSCHRRQQGSASISRSHSPRCSVPSRARPPSSGGGPPPAPSPRSDPSSRASSCTVEFGYNGFPTRSALGLFSASMQRWMLIKIDGLLASVVLDVDYMLDVVLFHADTIVISLLLTLTLLLPLFVLCH